LLRVVRSMLCDLYIVNSVSCLVSCCASFRVVLRFVLCFVSCCASFRVVLCFVLCFVLCAALKSNPTLCMSAPGIDPAVAVQMAACNASDPRQVTFASPGALALCE
jgi:hypothetical protein